MNKEISIHFAFHSICQIRETVPPRSSLLITSDCFQVALAQISKVTMVDCQIMSIIIIF